MKRILLIISLILLFVAILAILYFVLINKPIQTGSKDQVVLSPTPTENLTNQPYLEIGRFRVSWIVVRDMRKIVLFNNLKDNINSLEARIKNGCVFLTSGGFYTKEDKPIGLLVNDGETISEAIESELFDGFFNIPNEGKFTITYTPLDRARISIQSGPVLFKDKKPVTLELKNDSHARRIVAASDRNGNLILMVLYDKTSQYLGPLLEEVPMQLEEIQKKTSLSIVDAINLDGGSASAFIGDSFNLTEATKSGQFLCIKP